MLFRRKKMTLLAALALASKSKAARAALATVGSIFIIQALRNRKYRAKKLISRVTGR